MHQYVQFQENEQLKEDLKKETYKRKKLKERFLQLQELVNDENVVLLKEVTFTHIYILSISPFIEQN